ncbi:TPA: hypothetical protein ACNUTR_003626 [Vibrio cholerae]
MAANYSGFSVCQMLSYLNEHSTTVNLEKVEDKWRLYVFCDLYGEFENVGTLLQVVMQAFKPHLKSARIERESFQSEWDKLQSFIDNNPHREN